MAGLVNYGCLGTLTINGLALASPAWDIPTDLGVLWNSRSTRGKNRLVGGASGRRAKRRRFDEFEFPLGLIVVGHADKTGAPIANALHGLIANQDELREELVDPVALDGAATVTASLTIPGQAARTAEVQCDLEFGPPQLRGTSKSFSRGVLVLTIPTPGYFA